MLILERPWTRQPQTVVGIDWGNPLAAGLVSAWVNPSLGGYDAARNNPASFVGRSTVITSDGVGFSCAGSSGYMSVPDSGSLALTGDWTYSVWSKRNGIDFAVNGPLFAQWNSTTSGRQIFFGYSNTNNKIALDVPYIKAILLSVSAITDTTTYHHIVATKKGTLWSIYLNGTLNNSATDATAQENSTDVLGIGAGLTVGQTQFTNAVLRLPTIHNRALSADEIRLLYRNPWQLFQPRRIYIPTAAAAAASTYTLSSPTYGVLTSSTVTPRVTVTVA